MRNTLTQCTWRFFFGTYNVVLVIVILALAFRVFTRESYALSILGAVGGALAYMFSEAYVHRHMHVSGTIFFNSHAEHHTKKTPESGLPKPWLYAFYLTVGVILFTFNLPILQGFYLGLILYLTTYEYVHFLCHCNYKPKTKLGWRIRVNHLKHHNHDDKQHFELMFLKRVRSSNKTA